MAGDLLRALLVILAFAAPLLLAWWLLVGLPQRRNRRSRTPEDR